MTALADRAGPRSRITACKRGWLPALLAAVIVLIPTPAIAAQVGAVVSVFSDERFRGVSVSDGRPVATLGLSYDAASGLYANLTGTLVAARDEGPRLLSGVFNGGYAVRLRTNVTADFGVSHTRYSHYSGLSYGRDFTEAYAGLAGKTFGGRISVSPDYFGIARWTVHGELDGHVDLSRNTTLEGQAGLLTPLGRDAYEAKLDSQLDARVGVAQRVGPVTFHASVSGRSGSDEIYGRHGRHRVALVFGVSTVL